MRCKSCESIFNEDYMKDSKCPCCKAYIDSNKDWSEHRVRCLGCGAEFYENLIPIDEEEKELCPVCGMSGRLMDI